MHKQDRITYLALYDPLTGLPNRTLFHERLTQSLQSAGRNNASLALVLIDLERFKAINDTLGQQAGDGVLQAVAQRLGSAAGDINRLARLGSNLFAVMLRQIGGAPGPPVTFSPVLEQTGLILEAGRQAIAAATGTYRSWQAQGLEPPRIAVNVSQLQLRRKTFVEEVRAALRADGADGGGVDLEITESLLMHDVDESIRKLAALRDSGLRISLDDFGTGFSSLAYLSRLPLDTLKIDRGFVQGMTENPHDTSIVGTIISLAQALRLKVVAEGVETEQQAQLLRLLRCDQAQGFVFSRPVPAEDIEALLKK